MSDHLGHTPLDERAVGPYLRDRGVISESPRVVRALGGGVSNVVLLVDTGRQRLVVKQSLPRLRVAEEWIAKRERALNEAAALRLAAEATPGAVPRVLDVDTDACALVIDAAPDGWVTWKDQLLDGVVAPEVGGRLGAVLGAWHRVGVQAGVPDDAEAFEQLRLDPYHHTAATRNPEVAPRVLAAAETLRQRRICLVHGDYSPKNVLVAPDDEGLWVIDFEVAHAGNPVFDVAFLLSHLALKTLHRPVLAAQLHAAADRFLVEYQRTGAPGADDDEGLAVHVACLLLARVDGKSPAEYLLAEEAGAVRSIATTALGRTGTSVAELWSRVLDGAHARLGAA